MANKKPLTLYSGELSEIQSGDGIGVESVNVSGLTATKLVGTDSSKDLISINVGTGLTLDGMNTLNADPASVTWGAITGTLSDQTDLQTELTGIDMELSMKADSSHTHVMADITDLDLYDSMDFMSDFGGSSIDGLSDVNVSTPGNNEVLTYNSGSWISEPVKIQVSENDTLIGTRKEINFIAGTNVTLDLVDDSMGEKVDVTINASGGGGGGSLNTGTTTLDFGSFPGTSDASIVVTGQTGIITGSTVWCWLYPANTSDHTADEHMLETIKVVAGNIVAGTGFTIYGFNTSEIFEPLTAGASGRAAVTTFGAQSNDSGARIGGRGTRIYGQWTVKWAWS